MHLPPIDVAVYPVVTMDYGRQLSRSAWASPAVESIPSRSSAASPIRTPIADFLSIQRAIQRVFQSSQVSVQQAERLQGRIHQVYLAKLSDGGVFVLKCPPHISTRALRHERHGLETEFATLNHIRKLYQGQIPLPEIYSPNCHEPFLLMRYIPGRTLFEMLSHITIYERNMIDRTLGAYVRAITNAMPKKSLFGVAHDVFAEKGSKSWREAFRGLLESALRDAEDMLICLPYNDIRAYTEQHTRALDEIHTPYMVAMDACDPRNVIVHEQTRQVIGLVGFSNVIFGDPLMSEGIANGSDAFFEGYGEKLPHAGAPFARYLMYIIYRATVQIASLHYRPQPRLNGDDARRSLTYAISTLAAL